MTLHTVLVANRGEIAVRIVRACADAGLASVAVYADGDADAPHVRLADSAYPLDGATAAETYLDQRKLLDVADRAGADAVHPGYGFLAENADFAQAVIDAGLTWIGPTPQAIRDLGDKVTARRIAAAVGAPLVAGSTGPVADAEEVLAFAAEHGLPVAIKAVYGGGGRGLKVARTAAEIPELLDSAVREARAAFGRGDCFVERYVDRPRHVEAQVLADTHGTVIVVGTRDCSLQRRHQKLVEEAPAPLPTDAQRTEIHAAARAICVAAGYHGAGTVEFLVAHDGVISFLEVNTRLQVEHPVSEETTGLDLVAEQFRIAAGEPLRITEDPVPVGHSIEFRINGEDPTRGFLPTPGTVTVWEPPCGPGIRVDAGVAVGTVVGDRFDSLLAKLVVTGTDRRHALARARRALAEFRVDRLPTVPFHRAVVDDPAFTAVDGFGVHTRWIETEFHPATPPDELTVTVQIGGRLPHVVALPGLAAVGATTAASIRAGARQARTGAAQGDDVTAPMQGTVVTIAVADRDTVRTGDLVAVVEAMKMENPVVAHRDGTVAGLAVGPGASVGQGALLCRIVD